MIPKKATNKEEEKENIRKLFEHYYGNCLEWSLDEIGYQLRIDFLHPNYLSWDEVVKEIDGLCSVEELD